MIVQKLVRLMKRGAGLSFREWGERSGVHYTTICAVAEGKRTLRMEQFEAIARAAGYRVQLRLFRRRRKAA